MLPFGIEKSFTGALGWLEVGGHRAQTGCMLGILRLAMRAYGAFIIPYIIPHAQFITAYVTAQAQRAANSLYRVNANSPHTSYIGQLQAIVQLHTFLRQLRRLTT